MIVAAGLLALTALSGAMTLILESTQWQEAVEAKREGQIETLSPLQNFAKSLNAVGIAENRTKAAFPDIAISTLMSRPALAEASTWASDHAAFRQPQIFAINALKWYGFKSSDNERVRVGKRGWLYYGGEIMTRDFERSDGGVFEGEYKAAMHTWLEEVEAWGRAEGRRIIFVVAPNKHTIYPEHMPGNVSRGAEPANARLLEALAAEVAPSLAVPMTDALVAAKADRKVYYRIDTHWNYFGGLTGSRAIADALMSGPNPVTLVPEPDYASEPAIESPGNFGQLMGLSLEETEEKPVPVGGWAIKRASLTKAEKKLLPDPTRAISVFKQPSVKGPTLLVLGDSFMEGMQQPLASRFKRTVFMNLWSTENIPPNRFPLKLIKKIDPDVVIIEIVERRLRACDINCKGTFIPALPMPLRNKRLAQMASGARSSEAVTAQPQDDGHIILQFSHPVPDAYTVVLEIAVRRGQTGLIGQAVCAPASLACDLSDIHLQGERGPQYILVALNEDRNGINLRTEGITMAEAAKLKFVAHTIPQAPF